MARSPITARPGLKVSLERRCTAGLGAPTVAPAICGLDDASLGTQQQPPRELEEC